MWTASSALSTCGARALTCSHAAVILDSAEVLTFYLEGTTLPSSADVERCLAAVPGLALCNQLRNARLFSFGVRQPHTWRRTCRACHAALCAAGI